VLSRVSTFAFLILLVPACSSSSAGHAALDDGSGGAATTPSPGTIVTVAGDQGSLEGSLLVPAGAGPVPVALILSGSGPQDRDGNTPGSAARTDVYRLLAEGLLASGIASLRFDDPGVGKSVTALPASEAAVTYPMEVAACGKWIPFLKADARFSRLVLIGHSEGALTATLLAEAGDAAVLVSLAGAGRPIDVVLREQLAPELTPDQLSKLDSALLQLKMGVLPGPQAPPLDQLLRPSAQPYLASWMAYDPRAEMAKITVPTLILQGRTDLQVSEQDAMLLAAGKPDATLTFIDDMNHVLKRATVKSAGAQAAQYSDPTVPLHPGVVPAIATIVGAP
jgi:hypothetical protein